MSGYLDTPREKINQVVRFYLENNRNKQLTMRRFNLSDWAPFAFLWATGHPNEIYPSRRKAIKEMYGEPGSLLTSEKLAAALPPSGVDFAFKPSPQIDALEVLEKVIAEVKTGRETIASLRDEVETYKGLLEASEAEYAKLKQERDRLRAASVEMQNIYARGD